MKTGVFKVYSLGYVAKDIAEDEMYIDVFPIELLPSTNTELSVEDGIERDIVSGDNNESISVIKGSLIKAKWLARGSMRLEPPTVCKGETVILYRYSNTDKFFWEPLGHEIHLRKNEKATYVFSNKKSTENGDITAAYYITIDTINKVLRLHTDDSDEELTTYDIELNTKDGYLTLLDGKGNEITLDSKNDDLKIKTNKTLNIETLDKTVNIDNLTINAKKDYVTDIKGEYKQIIGKNKKEEIGGRYDIELKSLSISNGSDEIVSLISDICQAIIDYQAIGNMGKPTMTHPATMSAVNAIKAKVEGFK